MDKPFLMNFRQEVPCIDPAELVEGDYYCEERQLRVFPDGQPSWSARTSRCPTSCGTPGKYLKAGYTKSGKWKPSKWIPSKTDKRVGK